MAHIYGTGSPYLRRRRRTLAEGALLVFACLEGAIYSLHWLHFLPTSLTLLGLAALLLAIGFLGESLHLVETEYFKYFDGIFGEDRVVKVLRALPDDYSIFRNLRLSPLGDIDVVVIGPAGVFALEVKSHVGRVGFDGRELTDYGRRFAEKDFLQQAMNEALALRAHLAGALKRKVFVHPVVVFASRHVGLRFGMRPVRGVQVMKKEWVTQFITRTPVGSVTDQQAIERALMLLLPT